MCSMSVQHSNIPACVPMFGARVGGGSESERAGYESRVRELLARRLVRSDYNVVAGLSAALDASVKRGVWDLRELRLYGVRAGLDQLWARVGCVPGVPCVPVPRVAWLADTVPARARVRGPKVAGWRGAKPKAPGAGAGVCNG